MFRPPRPRRRLLLLLVPLSLGLCSLTCGPRPPEQKGPPPMSDLTSRLTLERIGPPDATVGVVSLPLPREEATRLSLDAPLSGFQPVGWWERDRVPRRVMAYVVDDRAIPDRLRLSIDQPPARVDVGADGWWCESRTSFERLPFKNVQKWDYDALRGYPAADCTLVEGEVGLTYGDRTLMIRVGATGPDSGSAGPGGIYYWQNVQTEELWSNAAAQAFRAGGIIYNSDTFLWADLYLVLYANGVAQVSVHFTNTRLAIDGYDFQGLPVIRFGGEFATPAAEHALPADGLRFKLGPLDLNLADAAVLCSPEEPGRLKVAPTEILWYPVSRTYHFSPTRAGAPPTEWTRGLGRTMPFAFSLSAAAPIVARYRVPAWWYAACGELWAEDYLPVKGRLFPVQEEAAREASKFRRGRFDYGAGTGDDGYEGSALMLNYYMTGAPEMLDAARLYCTYWTDMFVDHNDHTIHQAAAWPYKTGAYIKFRDILYAWLESGDPYYLDNLEMCSDAYYAWFRSNWPRNSIGRDDFGMGDYALMWRFLGSENARERTLELLSMNKAVVAKRGNVGGQMGAGPHPGYHPSLFMTGVAMTSMAEVAEAAAQAGDKATRIEVDVMLTDMSSHFMRDDVEYYPSNYANPRAQWGGSHRSSWALQANRIFAELARLEGRETDGTRAGLAKARQMESGTPEEMGRDGGARDTRYFDPIWTDALMLGARVSGNGLEIAPLGSFDQWPARQTILTPFGDVAMSVALSGERAEVTFESASDFPITLRYGGKEVKTSSRGKCSLER